MGSEMTAAAVGGVGQVRRDPMAMLPFCGYNMGDYFRHWLGMRKNIKHPPRIFHVNWFRKDAAGKFWPGFGENMRVLKWIVDRCAERTQIGCIPRPEDIDLEGLASVSKDQIKELLAVKPEEWTTELEEQAKFFETLQPDMPPELLAQHESWRSDWGNDLWKRTLPAC